MLSYDGGPVFIVPQMHRADADTAGDSNEQRKAAQEVSLLCHGPLHSAIDGWTRGRESRLRRREADVSRWLRA